MGANTKIEWCDFSFNPWRGCQKVAAGCANCYAEAQAKRAPKTLGIWGPNGTRVVAAESAWRQVEKWDRDWLIQCETYAAEVAEWDSWNGTEPPSLPYSRSVFCGSMCDVFEDWPGVVRDSHGRPLHNAKAWQAKGEWIGIDGMMMGRSLIKLADVRSRVFRLIDATRLTWLLLTKRPENIRRMIPRKADRPDVIVDGKTNIACWHRDNVWLGTSIACQEDADRNITELLRCRDLCAGLFLSVEPLVGAVDLSTTCVHVSRETYGIGGAYMSPPHAGIDQVIIGGESGPHARPCNIAWIRSIVRQCADAGVPCFVKQVGSRAIEWDAAADGLGGVTGGGGDVPWPTVDRKGGDPAEWPQDLRVRQLAWRAGA